MDLSDHLWEISITKKRKKVPKSDGNAVANFRVIINVLNSHCYFCNILSRFSCAIEIHTVTEEKRCNVFTTTSEVRVFLV